jgi:hypothetical protein
MLNMRKKLVFLLALGAALAFGAQSALAATETFFDIDSRGGAKLRSWFNNTASGTFDITLDGIEGDSYSVGAPYFSSPRIFADVGGFEPGVHQVVSATVFIMVTDDTDRFSSEYLELELDGIGAGGRYEIDFGDVIGVDVGGTLLASINADGQLDYKVTADRGDFQIHYVALEVTAERGGVVDMPGDQTPGSHMPEPSAALLFGIGSIFISQRLRRNRI